MNLRHLSIDQTTYLPYADFCCQSSPTWLNLLTFSYYIIIWTREGNMGLSISPSLKNNLFDCLDKWINLTLTLTIISNWNKISLSTNTWLSRLYALNFRALISSLAPALFHQKALLRTNSFTKMWLKCFGPWLYSNEFRAVDHTTLSHKFLINFLLEDLT